MLHDAKRPNGPPLLGGEPVDGSGLMPHLLLLPLGVVGAVRDRDAALAEMTRDASVSFERGDLRDAARRYQGILGSFPDDPVAKSMLAVCAEGVQVINA
jgi:hypothetical protein